jgi:hypothetical protein
MNYISRKTRMRFFTMLWTRFRQAFNTFSHPFAFSCFSLFFPSEILNFHTNRIQREFLFNDAIQSQKPNAVNLAAAHAQNFFQKSPFVQTSLIPSLSSPPINEPLSLVRRANKR